MTAETNRKPITGKDLRQAMLDANDERHPAHQAFFGLTEVSGEMLIDGRIDLNRVAELLNEAKP